MTLSTTIRQVILAQPAPRSLADVARIFERNATFLTFAYYRPVTSHNLAGSKVPLHFLGQSTSFDTHVR